MTTSRIPGLSVSVVSRLSLDPMIPATTPVMASPSTIQVKTRWRKVWKKAVSARPNADSMPPVVRRG